MRLLTCLLSGILYLEAMTARALESKPRSIFARLRSNVFKPAMNRDVAPSVVMDGETLDYRLYQKGDKFGLISDVVAADCQLHLCWVGVERKTKEVIAVVEVVIPDRTATKEITDALRAKM
ncbi:hypothetical protein Pmar_PMAR024658 [Perkinsus marinus ATCC 50983]|uniref:Uncharacterized protein n=1 Tax=Perkinsus marinus (strain ATCC 50983 / TXsc) TaxID=423536 RepID=C5M197_PERM5|nr:hypothetical protein Pmar_PMAR024658 [Perkinsus marinus ATCC 50983]EEQ97219.1 hypothetical protein Pmar_PMAR024658 [Perkinsus marinus ATCC 50983]|eukprot:XP_002764502.1 hypothetical protein Pmar_PMAR024658 [Perkinsus marinus ATCC 50983]